jgi:hypothetical protein
MDDEPPQDDGPNFSSLNPMGSTLLFPNSCRQRVSFAQKLGVGKAYKSIDFILPLWKNSPL